MKNINENFIHNCNCDKVNIKDYMKSMTELTWSNDELFQIIDFYLCHAPIVKASKKIDGNLFGLKKLRDYGWFGNSGKEGLTKLEGLLLQSSNIQNFCMLNSNSIDDTLKSMHMYDEICSVHPRSVLKRNVKIEVLENNSVNINPTETRMEALFRHIRNSLAHNRLYGFDNGNIMLEDINEKKKITARILISKNTLLDWIPIIKCENDII